MCSWHSIDRRIVDSGHGDGHGVGIRQGCAASVTAIAGLQGQGVCAVVIERRCVSHSVGAAQSGIDLRHGAGEGDAGGAAARNGGGAAGHGQGAIGHTQGDGHAAAVRIQVGHAQAGDDQRRVFRRALCSWHGVDRRIVDRADADGHGVGCAGERTGAAIGGGADFAAHGPAGFVPSDEGHGVGGAAVDVGRWLVVQACGGVRRQQQSAGAADSAHGRPRGARVGAVVQRAVGGVGACDGDALDSGRVGVADAAHQGADEVTHHTHGGGCVFTQTGEGEHGVGQHRGVVGAGESHFDDLACAVGTDGGEAVFVSLARHKLVVGSTHGVRPCAVGAHREGAVVVVARCARLRHKSGGAVHVGDGQRAAGVQGCIGFGQGTGGDAANHSCVIGAGDVDGDRLAGAIGTHGRERFGVDLTSHKFIVRAVHGVGPHARAAERERAVAACSARLRGEGGGAIDVSNVQGAAGAEGCIGFGQGFDGVASDDGGIVGAGQRDSDGLGGAVGGFGGVAVGVGLAVDQCVVGTVHGVGPHACTVDAEHAVAVVTRDVAFDMEGGSVVHIGDAERAGGVLSRIGFGQDRRADTVDDRRVVAAVEGDGDGLGGAIRRHGREAVGVVGACH